MTPRHLLPRRRPHLRALVLVAICVLAVVSAQDTTPTTPATGTGTGTGANGAATNANGATTPTTSPANPTTTTTAPVNTPSTSPVAGGTTTTPPTNTKVTTPPVNTPVTNANAAVNTSRATPATPAIPGKTSAAAAAAAAAATATTEATNVDNSAVNVDPKSQYGTKGPDGGSPSGSAANATSSAGSGGSSVGSWLVPVIIATVVVGALVFVSFMKKSDIADDPNARDAGGHRRATSYFEHPRTNKSHLSSKHDDLLDSTPVLGNSAHNTPNRAISGVSLASNNGNGGGLAISGNGSDSVLTQQAPLKKHSSTMLTTSTGAGSLPNDDMARRSSTKSDEVSVMLEASMESFPRMMSPQSSVGSSFKTPEPGTSVIL